jgi:hypothetical protein
MAQSDFVEVLIMLDGAELCDGLCHLTAGIKITDPRAVDPHDGKPLSCFGDGMGHILARKSCNYCFAIKCLLGKDSKEAYQEFSDFFSFFERLMKEGLLASDCSGAQKNGNTHFCHVCPCTGN